MENQHFLDKTDLKVQNERPTFLTVLCIITFVVSGLFALSSIYSAITYSKEAQIAASENTIEDLVEMSEQEGIGEGMDNIISAMEVFNQENLDNSAMIMTINVIGSLLSLLGAFLMYRLRKVGFHIYLSSKVLSLVPILFFTLSVPVFLSYGIFLFFTIAFVIMYSRNVKYMS